MYEKLKDKAVDMIKEAKAKNEFVASKIQKKLKKEFDKVPSDQTIRNRAKDINGKIEESDNREGRDEYLTVEDKDGNRLNQIEPAVKKAEEVCKSRGIDLTKWKMVKIEVGEHQKSMKDEWEEELVSVTDPNIRITLKRDYTQEDKKAALEAIHEAHKDKREHKEYKTNNKNEIGVINPADLHLGKIAYEFISGDEYNIAIAKQRLKRKLDETITKMKLGGMPSELIFVIGNDGLNIDGPDQATTSGTPQDQEGMYKNAKQELIKLRIKTIELLKNQASLKVVNVAGNHDKETSISIYNMLRASYDEDENVSFNTDKSFKEQPISNCQKWQAIKRGNNLFCFNHGDKYTSNAKKKKIPNDVRTRYSNMIDEDTHIYVFMGHEHTERKQEEKTINQMNGVTIFWLPSLAGDDVFHDENDYIGNPKALESFIFNKKKGSHQSITIEAE